MTNPTPADPKAVLFVDDEEKARKYFKLAFAKDFRVLTAANVGDALEVLEREGDAIAILITDQRMPGQQGVDLLKRARAGWPHIVRMLTTAYSDLDDAIAAVNRGEILRYVTKPWDLESLRADLRHGMEFFELRKERDLLIEEKLSVRDRVAVADRLRSLLAIAVGLTNLRHVPHALSAWVRGPTACGMGGGDTLADQRELWGVEVHQTQELMDLHRRARALDGAARGGFPDHVDTRGLLQETGYEPHGDGPAIGADAPLLRRLLTELRPLVRQEAEVYEAAPGGLRVPGLALSLAFDLAEADVFDGCPPVLFDAYLIAWHHGGSICIERRPDAGRVLLTLPTDPDQARMEEPDANWISDQFALLEP